MKRDRRPLNARISVESLEGRALLSGATTAGLHIAGAGLVHASSIKIDPGGESAILGALQGGIGSEWATLIRREVKNPLGVIAKFETGATTAYSIPGLTFREPASQSQFTGDVYDQLLPTVAGAAVYKGNALELAAILRGPFHDPNPSEYVFALDRGAGARLGPTFASRPGITPDALVTITAGPMGSSATGTILDLTTGSTQAINPSQIAIKGATLRVFLNVNQLPSEGAKLANYKFAMWTQTQPGNDIANVAGFAPEASMIPIGVQKNVAIHR